MKQKFLIAVVLVALIALNVLSQYAFLRFDWTEQDKYTISDTSINLLSKLDDRVHVKAYFSKELPPQFLTVKHYLRDMLSEYQAYGGNSFSFEFIDPEGNDSLQQEMSKIGIQQVRMQVRENDSLQVKNGYLGMGVFYKDKSEGIPLLQQQDLANLEFTISSLILKLSLPRLPSVAFLKGHGEHDVGYEFEIPGIAPAPDQDYRIVGKFLRKNVQVRTVDFARGESLDGVDVLIVAGPKRNLTDRAIFEIDQFLLRGGKAIFLIDSVAREENTIFHRVMDLNIKTLLDPLGIRVPSKIVFDQVSEFGQFSEGPGQFFVLPYPPFIRLTAQNFSGNPIIQKIKSLVVRFVSPIEITEKPGIAVDRFLNTSPNSWVQAPPFQLSPTAYPQPKPEEINSFPVAVQISGNLPRISTVSAVPPLQEWKEDVKKQWKLQSVSDDPRKKGKNVITQAEKPSTVIIVSDSDLISDSALRDDEVPLIVFLNMVDSLSLGDDLIGIRGKIFDAAPIAELSKSQKTVIKIIGTLLVPFLICIAGVIRLFLRRRDEQRG